MHLIHAAQCAVAYCALRLGKVNRDMNPQIQHRIDQLLLEQGEYIPLEFLLAEGHLLYSDYEQWRSGKLKLLDENLAGNLPHIRKDLTRAAVYARALGLQPTPLDYHAWGESKALHFSSDYLLDSLFHEGYCKNKEQPQLDLFMDTTGANLANDIVRALGRRDAVAAGELLEKLYQTDPAQHRLGKLELLLDAMQQQNLPIKDPEEELADLQDEIQPLAVEMLGRESRPFMEPLWRRLGEALAGRNFDPQQPELHRSYTALRSLDWMAVIEVVEAEPDWRSHAVLLQRHARACDQLQRPVDALLDRFHLCWRFPEQAALVQTDATFDMMRAWELFQELEPELESSRFPAWLLTIRPGLSDQLPSPVAGMPKDYRLLYALQREKDKLGAKSMRLRGELKTLNPELFHHFIANR
ncbi:MAG: hypothetical protein U9Q75_04635 [Pseudomonadota bacterium]|nr:hypothetical protein [Pseudomonadota bacterium]